MSKQSDITIITSVIGIETEHHNFANISFMKTVDGIDPEYQSVTKDGEKIAMKFGGIPINHFNHTGDDDEIMRGIISQVINVLALVRQNSENANYEELAKRLSEKYLPKL